MSDEAERISNARAPIRIECTVPGHEGEYVIFRADGWKYRHLRDWEEAKSARVLAAVISERIQSWHLLDEGKEIPFKSGQTAMNDLSSETSSWLIFAFRDAYQRSGRPVPNA